MKRVIGPGELMPQDHSKNGTDGRKINVYKYSFGIGITHVQLAPQFIP